MRGALSWTAVTPVWLVLMLREEAWGKGPQSCTVSGYQCDVWSYSLICTCWGHNVVRALFLRMLSTLFIYLLSNPKRVNQKPQWRTQGNGYWCKVATDLFSPLWIGLSCFCALVCIGFLIKTRMACCVTWEEVLEGRLVSLPVQWVAVGSPPHSYSRLDLSLYLKFFTRNVYFHSVASFRSLFLYWFAPKLRSVDI